MGEGNHLIFLHLPVARLLFAVCCLLVYRLLVHSFLFADCSVMIAVITFANSAPPTTPVGIEIDTSSFARCTLQRATATMKACIIAVICIMRCHAQVKIRTSFRRRGVRR
jgi:hypothetical protein